MRPNFKSAGLLIGAIILLLSLSCTSVPWLNDCTQFSGDWETSIPVIVVGRIVSNVAIREEHGSCRDKYFPVQLYRVTVDVENVLRGKNIPNEIRVYYFSGVGSQGGPARLGMRENGGRWRVGDRELFLLRWDSGVLRTKCDTLAACVYPVLTGAHPGFRVDPTKPIAYSVVRLLLSRGEGCSDKQMIEAIESLQSWNLSEKYALTRLLDIAETETPPVRNAACQDLADVAEAMHTSFPGFDRTCPGVRSKLGVRPAFQPTWSHADARSSSCPRRSRSSSTLSAY